MSVVKHIGKEIVGGSKVGRKKEDVKDIKKDK